MLLLPQRLERGHRWMQPKEAIQIEHAQARNSDAGAHVVVRLLTMRHYDVQTVGRAALKENDQALRSWSSGFRGIHRARKKTGNHAGTHNGQRAVLQKNSASNGHLLLLKSSQKPLKHGGKE